MSNFNQKVKEYTCRCEQYLSIPENIEPVHLAEYLAGNSHFGVNDHICSIVQDYFYRAHNIGHPLLFRYIQLIDRLISHCYPLPISLPKMYALCYEQAARTQHKAITQQLQIMRKAWTPLLQDSLISELRLCVYNIIKIDIDIGLPVQAKNYLAKHFSAAFNMSREQIDTIINKFQPMQIPRAHKFNSDKDKSRNNTELGHSMRKRKKQCEDTEDTEDNNREKALLLLNKLKNSKTFSCKECGQCFQTENAYESHKTKHFKRRLIKYNIKGLLRVAALRASMKFKRQEKTTQQWIKYEMEQAETIRKADTKIAKGSTVQLDQSCDICGDQFRIQVVDDELVYKSTVQVALTQPLCSNQLQKSFSANKQQLKKKLMHGECYLACIQS